VLRTLLMLPGVESLLDLADFEAEVYVCSALRLDPALGSESQYRLIR
jgi:hypothetical protein